MAANTLLSLLIWLLLLVAKPGQAQISGQCLDAQTGESIENVSIRTDGHLLARSNAHGAFTLTVDSTFRAHFWHPQYKPTDQVMVPGTHLLVLLSPNTHELNEVTISAPLMLYKKQEVPGSISHLPNNPLNPELDAAALVSRSPGVIYQQGALNTGRITIRGIGSRSPYSTTRIRAYLDNIPLTTGDGNTTLEDLEMFNIARVEIIRGPSSSLYGNGLGGAIVLHPDQTIAGPVDLKALLQRGPFDQTKAAINAGFKSKSSTLKTNASYTQTNGFRENSHYQRLNASVMYRTHFRNHSLSLSGNYISLKAQIPSSLDRNTYLREPEKAAANWLAIRGYETYDKWLSGLTLRSSINKKLKNRLSFFALHNNAYESRPFNILNDRSLALGLREEITLSTGSWKLTAGGELFNENYTWKLIETLGGREGELEAFNRERREWANIFGKVDYALNRQWNVSASSNLHLLQYSLKDILDDGINLSGTYRYDPIFSPRLGINGALNHKINLFAAIGHGFSVPNVEETLRPEGHINPDLLPEEGINTEVGMRGTALHRHLNFDVTAYLISLKNLLVTKRESEAVFYGINAGRTKHYGIEVELKSHWFLSQHQQAKIEIEMSHTLMRNYFTSFIDDDHDYSDNRLPGIPNQHTRLAITATAHNKAFGRIEWRHTGDQFLNDANTIKYNGYALLNLQASWLLFENTAIRGQLQTGLNNVLNTHYASMLLVNAPSFGGSAPRYYYPGLPRNAFVRVIIRVRPRKSHRLAKSL